MCQAVSRRNFTELTNHRFVLHESREVTCWWFKETTASRMVRLSLRGGNMRLLREHCRPIAAASLATSWRVTAVRWARLCLLSPVEHPLKASGVGRHLWVSELAGVPMSAIIPTTLMSLPMLMKVACCLLLVNYAGHSWCMHIAHGAQSWAGTNMWIKNNWYIGHRITWFKRLACLLNLLHGTKNIRNKKNN